MPAAAPECWTPGRPTGFPRSAATGADAAPEAGQGDGPADGPGEGTAHRRLSGVSPATSCMSSAPDPLAASIRRWPTGGVSPASNCRAQGGRARLARRGLIAAGERLLGPDDLPGCRPPRTPALRHLADHLESPAALVLVAGIPQPGQRRRIVQHLAH